MNGKAAKLLRKLESTKKSDKRLFQSLSHLQKGVVRQQAVYWANKEMVYPLTALVSQLPRPEGLGLRLHSDDPSSSSCATIG